MVVEGIVMGWVFERDWVMGKGESKTEMREITTPVEKPFVGSIAIGFIEAAVVKSLKVVIFAVLVAVCVTEMTNISC